MTHAKNKNLEEKHVPAPTDPPPSQEKADSDEANEAPDEVQRANNLRYKEYLGMMKMERHVKRKIIEGQTLRMPAPPPSAGGTSYEVGGVTAESLLGATKDKGVAG